MCTAGLVAIFYHHALCATKDRRFENLHHWDANFQAMPTGKKLHVTELNEVDVVHLQHFSAQLTAWAISPTLQNNDV
jgi:hypothetical protein